MPRKFSKNLLQKAEEEICIVDIVICWEYFWLNMLANLYTLWLLTQTKSTKAILAKTFKQQGSLFTDIYLTLVEKKSSSFQRKENTPGLTVSVVNACKRICVHKYIHTLNFMNCLYYGNSQVYPDMYTHLYSRWLHFEHVLLL